MNIPEIINNEDGWYEGDLKHYFKAVFRQNRGNNNPYHSIRHLLHVLWECHDAIQHLEVGKFPGENRALMIAALLHDANHIGKIGNDCENIEESVKFLREIATPEDQESGVIDLAVSYIWGTEYSKGHVRAALSEHHKILRDADLAQVTSSAWLRIIIFGLAAEVGISPEAMLRSQEVFLTSIKFESVWGRGKFPPLVVQRIEEARDLIAILDS